MHPEVSRQLFEEQVKRITGNPDLILDRGWLVLAETHPFLTIAVRHRATNKVRTFRFGFDNWNDLPPSLVLIDAETAEELAGNFWPTDNQSHWHQSGSSTNKPFMCMAGIREYHTHQSHITDLWENYKNQIGFDLPG